MPIKLSIDTHSETEAKLARVLSIMARDKRLRKFLQSFIMKLLRLNEQLFPGRIKEITFFETNKGVEIFVPREDDSPADKAKFVIEAGEPIKFQNNQFSQDVSLIRYHHTVVVTDLDNLETVSKRHITYMEQAVDFRSSEMKEVIQEIEEEGLNVAVLKTKHLQFEDTANPFHANEEQKKAIKRLLGNGYGVSVSYAEDPSTRKWPLLCHSYENRYDKPDKFDLHFASRFLLDPEIGRFDFPLKTIEKDAVFYLKKSQERSDYGTTYSFKLELSPTDVIKVVRLNMKVFQNGLPSIPNRNALKRFLKRNRNEIEYLRQQLKETNIKYFVPVKTHVAMMGVLTDILGDELSEKIISPEQYEEILKEFMSIRDATEDNFYDRDIDGP